MSEQTSLQSREGEPADESGASVLVVDDDQSILLLLKTVLRMEGYEVTAADSGAAALERLADDVPDVIVSDVMMPDIDGFALIDALRRDGATEHIPLIFLTAMGEKSQVVEGLGLGADDYIAKPFDVDELLARIQAKIERPPVPRAALPHDRKTGLLSSDAMAKEIEHEVERARRSGRPGVLAQLEIYEGPRLLDRLGRRAMDGLARSFGELLRRTMEGLDLLGREDLYRFSILMPETTEEAADERLRRLSQSLAGASFTTGEESIQITPIIALAPFSSAEDGAGIKVNVQGALAHAAADLNLRPVRYRPGMEIPFERPAYDRPTVGSRRKGLAPVLRLAGQILLTVLLGLVLPFFAYVALDRAGLDVTPVVYLVVVLALTITGGLIWWEGSLALRRVDPPEPAGPYPPATAVVVAYLPNEAATVMETVRAFLEIEYPGPLQVILAYNTPTDLPVEVKLQSLAREDPRFLPLRVEGSNSKAQNLNAALSEVTGEFVGVFDADHHPAPESFRRAWAWLSNGWDVVQGRCRVRNGGASWVARLVAVEFEAMYGVAHPGRQRLHGFGIFGGSNGYWRTELLRQTRMHGFMLTEDIDSSFRVTESGRRIVSDPGLVSTELAPGSIRALWHQRMRWSQGWFQASLEHLRCGFTAPFLSLRQRFGYLHLLAWRELYPWLSLQVLPLIAYWMYRGDHLVWTTPIFVVTTLFTLSVGPGQTYFAYRLSSPETRRHRRWFWFHLLVSTPLYTEFKNLVCRVAQIKELMHEHDWRVTPRPRDQAHGD